MKHVTLALFLLFILPLQAFGQTELMPDCQTVPVGVLEALAAKPGDLLHLLGGMGFAVVLLGLVRDGLQALAEKTQNTWDNRAVQILTKAINVFNLVVGRFGFGNANTFRPKK